jgi:hypothetical protein
VQTGNAYDEFGRGFSTVRRADPWIAEAITEALGDAVTVLKVGAGTGSYEPADRRVVAIESSAEMLSQRSPDAAPAVQATAESLTDLRQDGGRLDGSLDDSPLDETR